MAAGFFFEISMAKKKEQQMTMSSNPVEEAKAKGKALRSSAFQRVMEKMDGWKPAPEVLVRVRAVPTIFPQFDFINRVGGLPLERVTVITGPSNHGKSAFALGLAASFIRGEHFAGYLDAERTTTIDWAQTMMRDVADDPRFLALRPDTYEDAVEATTRFCKNIAEAREAGDLPPNTGGVVLVDSLRKLVPKKIMDLISKEDLDAGVDGMNGRAGQIRALYNGAWMDILTPLMASTGCAIVLVVRETDDPNADPWDKKTGHDYKITGGKAIIFESGLLLRVTRASWVTEGKKEDGPAKVFGERHRLTVIKTKVAGKDTREPSGYFHTSNGVLIPAGFDRARDVVELGLNFKVIEQAGAWYSFNGERLGQGLNNVIVHLTEHAEVLVAIEAKVREQFDSREPEEEQS